MHVSSILKPAIRWGLVACATLAILQAHADLFVTSQTGSTRGDILRYSQADGSFLGIFASLGQNADPLGMTFGPDGNLYVADGTENQVLRYNGRTGAPMGEWHLISTGPFDVGVKGCGGHYAWAGL